MNSTTIRLIALTLGLSLASTAKASITLTPGTLVVGEQSPPTVQGVDAASGASTGSCACSACTSSIVDVAVLGTSAVYVATRYAVVEVLASSCANRLVAEIEVAFGFFKGIAIDASGTLLVTADDCLGCATGPFSTKYGGVLRVDRVTGDQTIFFSGEPLISPDGLDVAPDGRVYVAGEVTGTGAATYPSGVLRIDPAAPGAAAFVAIGDDGGDPIARTDIVRAMDVAIEADAGPVFVLDERYRGGTLQDELRLVSVDLAGAPASNQTLLTEDLEGINQDRSSGALLGIEVSGGTIYALDHVFSSGSSSDWAGIVAFTPGVSSAEGTHVTDESAFYYPSGLAMVPEPAAGASSLAALLVCALRAHRSRRA